MEIRSQQEALFIACEMEKSAIQLYTRALMLLEQQGRADDPIAVQIRQTCEDEREHLRQFRAHAQPLDGTLEEQLMLSAAAEGVLFEGGLMDAVRRGLLNDVSSMMNYAMAAEECSCPKIPTVRRSGAGRRHPCHAGNHRRGRGQAPFQPAKAGSIGKPLKYQGGVFS